MILESNILRSINRIGLENMKSKYPMVYNWLIARSKLVGMHPTKFQKELVNLLSRWPYPIDLSNRYARIVRV